MYSTIDGSHVRPASEWLSRRTKIALFFLGLLFFWLLATSGGSGDQEDFKNQDVVEQQEDDDNGGATTSWWNKKGVANTNLGDDEDMDESVDLYEEQEKETSVSVPDEDYQDDDDLDAGDVTDTDSYAEEGNDSEPEKQDEAVQKSTKDSDAEEEVSKSESAVEKEEEEEAADNDDESVTSVDEKFEEETSATEENDAESVEDNASTEKEDASANDETADVNVEEDKAASETESKEDGSWSESESQVFVDEDDDDAIEKEENLEKKSKGKKGKDKNNKDKTTTEENKKGKLTKEVVDQEVSSSAAGCSAVPKTTRVHFIDIPRSGGNMIEGQMREWAKKATPAVKFYRFDESVIAGSTSRCPKPALQSTLLTGRGYGFCSDIAASDDGLFSFTILRSPVPRTISMYDMNNDKFKTDRKHFANADISFSRLIKLYNSTTDVVEQGEKLLKIYANQQTKYLCGYDCFGSQLMSEDAILSKAKTNMMNIGAIATLDDLNSLTTQLRASLPFLVPKTFSKLQREREPRMPSTVDDEARAILTEWAWMDSQIYSDGKSLVEEKLGNAKKCLKSNDEGGN